jgi:hypothetical protein
MDCAQFEELEHEFIRIRSERTKLVLNGLLTLELEEQSSRDELRALFRLLDHKTEHGCQRV